MKVLFLIPETKKESWLEEFLQQYYKKLKPFCEFEKKSIKVGKSGRDDASLRKKEDAKYILSEIRPDDYVIALDEKGKTFSSMEFAKKVERIRDNSTKRVVFIVGGPYGLDEAVFGRAQEKISFSSMTMNHLVIQVFFLEQIYRAFTIIHKLPYHNE